MAKVLKWGWFWVCVMMVILLAAIILSDLASERELTREVYAEGMQVGYKLDREAQIALMEECVEDARGNPLESMDMTSRLLSRAIIAAAYFEYRTRDVIKPRTD